MKRKIYLLFAITLFGMVGNLIANPWEMSLQRLREGNERFVAGQSAHPNQSLERRQETASKGQKPFATILACSDSRVPVEVLFDQGVGDLFVVKVAGNVADVDEIATIEYGTEHLATPLLVVLGHTKCGAVTAVASGAHLEGHLPKLADKIKPAFEKVQKEHSDKHNLVDLTIKENVFQTISDIISNSKIIGHLIEEKKLQVVGAIYDIETGKIEWLGTHPDEKKLVEISKHSEAQHSDSKSFFTTKNFIFMAIFIVLVSLLATILVFILAKRKS